ncbi:MAG: SDR family oxidoreductase [Roseivirga sp.]|nr:SDR family oxidoreductase [Roseivirga sp.]
MNDLFSLSGKNILITGGSSGIGLQCVRTCLQMGANTIVISRNKDKLEQIHQELNTQNSIFYPQDITDHEKLEPIIKDAVSKVGKIDGFIHSAGIEMTSPLRLLTPDKFESIFSLNVISAFIIAKIISKNKYKGTNASYIFIASIMAELGQAGKVGYCSSKGALTAGARAMALEFASKGIRVNSILPGMISTDMSSKLLDTLSPEAQTEIEKMHPLGIGKVEDVANACIYLLSDASKWITGTNLIVDGGYSAK